MSEPTAITGFPDPHVATHAVGMPAYPSSTVKPSRRSSATRYFEVSTSWNPSSPYEKIWSLISCVSFARPSMSATRARFAASALAFGRAEAGRACAASSEGTRSAAASAKGSNECLALDVARALGMVTRGGVGR